MVLGNVHFAIKKVCKSGACATRHIALFGILIFLFASCAQPPSTVQMENLRIQNESAAQAESKVRELQAEQSAVQEELNATLARKAKLEALIQEKP